MENYVDLYTLQIAVGIMILAVSLSPWALFILIGPGSEE